MADVITFAICLFVVPFLIIFGAGSALALVVLVWRALGLGGKG